MAKITPANTIIVTALKDELMQEFVPEWRVIYSGIGKVNAAYVTLKALHQYKPTTVINFGTAGAITMGIHGIVRVREVFQRDMDVRPLGVELGVTPFEQDTGSIALGGDGVTCGSGDNFVTQLPELATDIVDMEAYAIAKVCLREGVNFMCYKFISDEANHEATSKWQENVSEGAYLFKTRILQTLS